MKIPRLYSKILYHRTRKEAAKSILKDGFKLGKKSRMESGEGIYTITNLEDANNSYNKKHYGNHLIKIELPDELEFEHGSKLDFMRKTKQGLYGNRIYKTPGTNGEVGVLHDLDKIQKLQVSRDNGKTWLDNI